MGNAGLLDNFILNMAEVVCDNMPKIFILTNPGLGNVSPFSNKFGMFKSLNFLQENIITLLLVLLYLISCSIPYSEHTFKLMLLSSLC